MNTCLQRLVLAVCILLPELALAGALPYDIVYVRQPRMGDQTFTWWPEVFHPARLDAGADLMLLHADGSEVCLLLGG